MTDFGADSKKLFTQWASVQDNKKLKNKPIEGQFCKWALPSKIKSPSKDKILITATGWVSQNSLRTRQLIFQPKIGKKK